MQECFFRDLRIFSHITRRSLSSRKLNCKISTGKWQINFSQNVPVLLKNKWHGYFFAYKSHICNIFSTPNPTQSQYWSNIFTKSFCDKSYIFQIQNAPSSKGFRSLFTRSFLVETLHFSFIQSENVKDLPNLLSLSSIQGLDLNFWDMYIWNTGLSI